MKQRKVGVLIFILFGLLCWKSLHAQDQAETNNLIADSVVVAIEKVPLRASAPQEGIFYSLGKHLGSIEKGEELKVTEVKKVKTLLSEQVWIQVERDKLRPKAEEPASGWVYSGNKGEKSCCFAIKR